MGDLIITPHYADERDIIEACGMGGKLIIGTFDSDGGNYRTNGVSLDLSALLPRGVGIVLIEPKSGYIFQYDYTAKKVKAYYPTKAQAVANSAGNQLIVTTGAVAATATDAATPHVDVPAGFRSAVDPGAGQEVTDNTAFNVDDVRFIAIGY